MPIGRIIFSSHGLPQQKFLSLLLKTVTEITVRDRKCAQDFSDPFRKFLCFEIHSHSLILAWEHLSWLTRTLLLSTHLPPPHLISLYFIPALATRSFPLLSLSQGPSSQLAFCPSLSGNIPQRHQFFQLCSRLSEKQLPPILL